MPRPIEDYGLYCTAQHRRVVPQPEEIETLFKCLLGLSNDVGLLAEEYDTDGRCKPGNFPQALTYTALSILPICCLHQKNRPSAPAKKANGLMDVMEGFRQALLPDYIVLGGGNTAKLKRLPPQTRHGDNADALLGGFRLWERQSRNATGADGSAWTIADEVNWNDPVADEEVT